QDRPTMADVAARLRPFAGDSRLSGLLDGPALPPSAAATTVAMRTASARPRSRRWWRKAAAVAAVILVATVAAALGFRDRRPAAPGPAPPPPRPAAPPPGAIPMNAAAAQAFRERWADYLGRPVESRNTLGMRFVLIPPGELGLDPEYRARIT